MLTKIWTIAYNRLYINFSDRNIVLIVIIAPLALATIIALAFGGITSGGTGGLSAIPVALVNNDSPVNLYGEPLRLSDIFEQALIPPAGTTDEAISENALWQLLDTRLVDDAENARRGVENGDYVTAVLIPEEFTARLIALSDAGGAGGAAIELYSSPASAIQGSVVRSVVDTISTQIATGQIAIAATNSAMGERAMQDPAFGRDYAAAAANGEYQPDFSSVFAPQQTIGIVQQSVRGEQVEFNPFVLFGTGQAVFFMMFMAMGGVSGLLYEKRDGILGRTMVTPTPRVVILIGKLLGVLITCMAQVAILLIAFTVVHGLLNGEFRLIFGSNLLGIAATVLALGVAASGFATVLMGLVSTPEQANAVGGIFAMVMGVFGGAFFNVSSLGPLSIISRLTINYWGVDAFIRLSRGDSDIALNLLVLLIIGVVTFAIGFVMVNRRLEG